MAKQPKKGKSLDRWEIAMVKAMLERGGYPDQEVLAYFTRPTRSVNHRVISEIRTGRKHKTVKSASQQELDTFMLAWPNLDPETGLHVLGDELLIKAREAMISAVHIFNGAGISFRTELFIVTSIVAWTYLLHAHYKQVGIDYRYKRVIAGRKTVVRTSNGAEKYWELGQCLRHEECPLEPGVVKNLEFLLDLRHEIEHRSTKRIDEAVSAKLQACCINFNDAIRSLFGLQYALEHRLSIALQFASFNVDQRELLKQAQNLPANIETMMNEFHENLTPDEQADPRFAYRIAFVQKTANRQASADEAIEFVRSDTAEAEEINRVLLKEVERSKYLPTEIVRTMHAEGFRKFSITKHTDLWKALGAKDKNKPYGTRIAKQWYWYEAWINRVREHCAENFEKYE
ncbi:MAG: DUF3644 domain-containing protein [Paracoccaceae bacterium]